MKDTFKPIITTLLSGLIVATFSVSFLQICHFQYDFSKTIEFIDYQTKLTFIQVVVVSIIYYWIYFITKANSLTTILIVFLSAIIGIGTQQKSMYRGEPIYPSDIYFLKDFTFLLEMLDTLILIAITVIFIILAISLFFFLKNRRKQRNNQNWVIRILGMFVTTFFIFYISQFNQPGNKVRAVFNQHTQWVSYSQEKNYSQNGVVSGIMYNLQAPAVDKPDNYSKEKIEELYTKYSQVADDINLERTGSLDDYNIIYIMSETFSDPLKIEGVSISDDPIPMYRKLTEHYLSGESLSQGYGGGTANIEFEALTGISLEALSSNITTPFIQLSSLMNDIPTIMKLVNQQSHKLTAIHPYNTTMYKRLENYQAMGFEDYRFQDDMDYDERIDSNTYISDESAYKELMDILLKSEEKDFIHLVTMQNHKPFVHKYDNVSVQVSGAPYNLEVAHYATGLQYSDEALKDLLDQLDQLDEKTIVIFWGDHLPSFYGSEGTELYDQNGRVTMSQTPLLIYTNFDEDTRDIGTISPIYFTNYVLEISQAPVTPFMALLDKLEMVLPAFKKGTYIERETEIKISRDQLKPSTQLLLEDYDLILYDITTGKNYSQNLGFY